MVKYNGISLKIERCRKKRDSGFGQSIFEQCKRALQTIMEEELKQKIDMLCFSQRIIVYYNEEQ